MATITTINSTDQFETTSRGVINTNFANLNTEIATTIHRDGSVAFTADQPMGGFKLTGLAAGSAAGNSVRYEQVMLLAGGNAMSGDLNMGANEIKNIAGINDNSDNEYLVFTSVASAVNYLTVRNAAAAAAPAILAAGSDTNIDINLVPKGTGHVQENAVRLNDWNYHNIGATVYLGTDQLNLVQDTWTKVLLDTELFDLGSNFADSRFTCTVAGYYAISGLVGFKTGTTVADKEYNGTVRLNGSNIILGTNYTNLTTGLSVVLPVKTMHLDANDYLELWARSRSGGDTVDLYGHQSANYLSVMLIKRD